MAEIKKVYKNGTAYDVLNSDTVGSALTAGTGIGISSNTISNTGVTSVNGSTGAVTVQETLVSGTNIKTVNGNSILGSGDLSVGGITKVFTLSSTSDLTTAQAAYDWYVNGGNPIVEYGTHAYYYMQIATSSIMLFSRCSCSGKISSGDWLLCNVYKFELSSGAVTSISSMKNTIRISTFAPTSVNNDVITLVY